MIGITGYVQSFPEIGTFIAAIKFLQMLQIFN